MTFSEDSGLAELSETALAELLADRRLSSLLGLLVFPPQPLEAALLVLSSEVLL